MSNLAVCQTCQALLPGDALFCPRCGTARSSAGAATQLLGGQPEPYAGRERETLSAIMLRYSAYLKDDAIFFAPMIPPKKLQNALQSYAPTAQDEGVWLLVDDSILGSAKDGLIITDQHLYARRDPFSQPLFFRLAQIDAVQVRREGSTHMLYINDVGSIYLNFSGERMVYLFAELLLEAVAALRPPGAGADAVEVLRALQVLHQARLLTSEELEDKRRVYLMRPA